MQSLYRPGEAFGFQDFEAPRISRKASQGGDKLVSPMHWPPLPPGDISGTHFC